MKKILFLTMLFTMLWAVDVNAETKKLYDIPLDGSLQSYVVDLCDLNDISPELVFAIMEVESCYTPDVVDASGKYVGLMQIHKSCYKQLQDRLGCPDLKDPQDNIVVGTKILKDLFKKYHDVDRVLMAYNGGEEYMLEITSRGIRSTAYTRKVLKAQERIYECKQ